MHRSLKWWEVIAVLIVCVCVIVGWMRWVDTPARRTYQAYVALDGKGPWGLTDPPWDGPDALVLYRSPRDGVVCFDAFHSKELHDRLSPKNGQRVTVEYDTFPSIFGGELGYNVHSVGGMILANGTHVLRGDFAGTAGVVASKRGDGTFSARENDCWR
jgi:hypothetical protein